MREMDRVANLPEKKETTMLAVTETALPGIGLSIPQVAIRDAAPYLAVAASGPMRDLPRFAPPKFAAVRDWMHERDILPGPGFFLYRRFDGDGGVELEVGNLAPAPVPGDDTVIAGELPAGRYVSATYTGPYDRLYDAFSMLDGWIRMRRLVPARHADGSGCQMEIYRIGPKETDDPARFETDILILLDQEGE